MTRPGRLAAHHCCCRLLTNPFSNHRRKQGADVQGLVADARRTWEQQALSGAPSPLILGTNLAARLLQPRWAPGDASGRLRYQPADCIVADLDVLEQAEPLLQHAYDSRVARLGASHPHSLTAQGNLAVCLFALGRADEAEQLFRAQQAGLEALGLPQGDPQLHESTVNLARSLEVRSRLEIPTALAQMCPDMQLTSSRASLRCCEFGKAKQS